MADGSASAHFHGHGGRSGMHQPFKEPAIQDPAIVGRVISSPCQWPPWTGQAEPEPEPTVPEGDAWDDLRGRVTKRAARVRA